MSAGGSKRTPVVSGLPVSSATTGAPSARSQAIAASSRSQTSRCNAGSPPGHSRRKSSKLRCRHDDARREQHRPARTRAALQHERARAQLGRAHGGAEPRHPGAGDDERLARQASANVDLCSTYSMRMPSGPVTNTAYVFAASTTDSTSMPSDSAAAAVVLGGIDEQAEMVQQRRTADVRLAVHEHELRASDLDRAERGTLQAVALEGGGRALGVGRQERDVVEVVVDVGRRLDQLDHEALAELERALCAGREERARRCEVGDA